MRILLTILLSLVCAGARAATVNAANTTYAAVNTALASCTHGDTLVIPAGGPTTWTSRLTVTVGITIQGNGTNTTIIVNGIPSDNDNASDEFPLIQHTTVNNNAFRVTGIQFRGNETLTDGFSGSSAQEFRHAISVSSAAGRPYFRIDNCLFVGIGNCVCIWVKDAANGLVDHNAFTVGRAAETIHHTAYGSGSGTGWTYNVVPGSFDALYVEYNYFTHNNPGSPYAYDYGATIIQSYFGARTVVRYNWVIHLEYDQHGTAGMRGARWWEIYSNTNSGLHGSGDGNAYQDKLMGIRAGSGVIFNNVWTGSVPIGGSGGGIVLYEEDSGYPAQDQIGRGKNQVLDPAYVWGNSSQFNPSSGSANVQQNRDWYATPKPGYSPAGAHPAATGGDVLPPTIISITVAANGTTVTYQLSEIVQFGAGGFNGWGLTPSGGGTTVTYASGTGTSTITCNSSRVINAGETMTGAFSQPGNGCEDPSGNDMITVSGLSVQNNSSQGDVIAPTVSSATIGANGNTIAFTFSEIVLVGPGGSGGMTITPSGGAATLSYTGGSGTTVITYNTSRYIDFRETVTRSYTQPGSGLEDTYGNDLANFTGQAVVNSSLANTIDIIPPDRYGPGVWQFTGIEGGIPSTFTVQFADVTQAPYSVDNTGTFDASAGIQAAIDACTAGQYVYIPPGDYRLNSRVNLKNNCVLRGAGNTTKLRSYAAWHALNIGDFPSAPVDTAVSGSLSVGASNITVASITTPALAVGDLIVIDQIDDGITVTNSPNDPGGTGTTPWPTRDSNTRGLGEIRQIVAINTLTLTVWPPLTHAYSATYSPEVWELNQAVSRTTNCGFENFRIDRLSPIDSSGYSNFKFVCADRCWIQGVESTNTIWWHVDLDRSFRCNIYNNNFMSCAFRGGGYGYGVVCGNVSSLHRIENNLFYRLRHSMVVVEASDNVYGYNLSYDSDQGDGWLAGDMFPHGCHSTMNLFEGNINCKIFNDWTHGSGDYNVYYRNFITGRSTYSTAQAGRRVIDNDIHNTYATYIGNVIGTNNAYSPWTAYETQGSRTTVGTYGFSWDFLNDSDGIVETLTPSAYGTVFRHGNYDDIDKEVKWALHYENHSLSNSLYLASKPSWFGDLTWPPIGPSSGSSEQFLDLPAGWRLTYGTNPVASVPPGTGLSKRGKLGRSSTPPQ